MIQAEISHRTFKMMATGMAEIFVVPVKQVPRVLFHGIILAFIICGFWLLDSLKDPVLANIVGIEYQPVAKFFSVLSTLIVVCLYDFATSMVSKPSLFHLVSWSYGLVMMIVSARLSDPAKGFDNKDKGPHRLLGWFTYFVVESYGSLMVTLFWSYTNSIMNLEEAKGAYGLIISIAQLGAIFGSTLATSASSLGISMLFLTGSILIFSVSILIKIYHLIFQDPVTLVAKQRTRSLSEDVSLEIERFGTPTASRPKESTEVVEWDRWVGADPGASNSSDAPPAKSSDPVNTSVASASSSLMILMRWIVHITSGFYEGVILISQHTYTLKLLGVSCLFEVILTILDYEFKVMGVHRVASQHNSISEEDKFANLLGHFGQLTNFLSLLVSLFVFSFLVRRLSVRWTLLIYPSLLFAAVIISNLAPKLSVLFVVVSVLKALTFSLGEPVKELLYMPTSDAIKFKTKAWIDIFGSRLAKAIGSFATGMSGSNVHVLRQTTEIPCILLSLFILALSWSIGGQFNWLVSHGVVIGETASTKSNSSNSINTEETIEEKYPERNGRRYGDVGYDGYDLHLFHGVFEEESELEIGK